VQLIPSNLAAASKLIGAQLAGKRSCAGGAQPLVAVSADRARQLIARTIKRLRRRVSSCKLLQLEEGVCDES